MSIAYEPAASWGEAAPRGRAARLLREILACIDWRAWEAKCHLPLGQPAIHPRVLASALLDGLLTRIRSSLGLAEACGWTSVDGPAATASTTRRSREFRRVCGAGGGCWLIAASEWVPRFVDSAQRASESAVAIAAQVARAQGHAVHHVHRQARQNLVGMEVVVPILVDGVDRE